MNQNKLDRLDGFNDIFISIFQWMEFNFDYSYALYGCVIIAEVKQDDSTSRTNWKRSDWWHFKMSADDEYFTIDLFIIIIYIMMRLSSWL